MYYKIDIKDEGRLDKNGTKEKKKEEKDTSIKMYSFFGNYCFFISCMGVYFYRIYKDTQLQNMVDQTCGKWR